MGAISDPNDTVEGDALVGSITPKKQAEVMRQIQEGTAPIAYGMSQKDHDELVARFTYHAPKSNQIPRYEKLRDLALQFAEVIHALTPPCREQALAFTYLEQASMWANAAIARREPYGFPKEDA